MGRLLRLLVSRLQHVSTQVAGCVPHVPQEAALVVQHRLCEDAEEG